MQKIDYIIDVRIGRDETGDKRIHMSAESVEMALDTMRRRYPGRKIRVRDQDGNTKHVDEGFTG